MNQQTKKPRLTRIFDFLHRTTVLVLVLGTIVGTGVLVNLMHQTYKNREAQRARIREYHETKKKKLVDMKYTNPNSPTENTATPTEKK
jgi:succinate dehydrogenase/fumarate reductase cytochrome b subunit